MKTKEANLLRFLHGAKQFIIPIYHTYLSTYLQLKIETMSAVAQRHY